MKIIKFPGITHGRGYEGLDEFLKPVIEGHTRPMIYIGLNNDGTCSLHLARMTWSELAHLKTSFEMHCIKDWLGMLGEDA